MKFILIIVMYSVILAQLSLAFNVSQEVWTTPTNIEAPSGEGSSTFFGAIADAIQAVLAPFRWVFNTIAVIFMFLTYQVEGIPALINTVMISPIGAGVLWLSVRLIRGGG